MKPEDCEDALEHALKRNSTVKFMLDAMRKAGCTVDRSFFRVETCEGNVVGGFRPPDGVVMCHNTVQDAREFENMLVHELVHAFDHCRAADMSWQNCRHHACSEARPGRRAACDLRVRARELCDQCRSLLAPRSSGVGLTQKAALRQVRAANLSGDCAWGMEFDRGNFNFTGQQRVCVRRRAELSVAMNPSCQGLGVARAAIDGCFDACMADTAPFERAP